MITKNLIFSILILALLVNYACDCDDTTCPQNEPPVISSLTSNPEKVGLSGSAILHCTASDPDSDKLTYVWESLSGSISGSGDSVTWIAPDEEGTNVINCKVLDGNGGEASENVTVNVEMDKLIYLKGGDPSNWTPQGGIYSQYEEIQHWLDEGLEVTTQDQNTTEITEALLDNYSIARIHSGGAISEDEGDALYNWVTNGGKLFVEVYQASDLPGINNFGVSDIEGLHGGSSGLQWHYHGAPLLASPVSGSPLFAGVSSIACASMDRTYLASGHTLTIDATISGYPAVVHGEFGSGKVIIVFFIHWSHDKTKPNNAYRADIFQADNIQFLENCIEYFKQ